MFTPNSIILYVKGRIIACLHVQGPPLDDLDPYRYTLKLTNGSDQNFMDPLNLTRHGMSKSFAELLTPKNVIVNTKRLHIGPLEFSLDP